MSDRERLIELMVEARKADGDETIPFFDHLADHLIANGVVIPVGCKDCKMRCPESITVVKHCTLTGVPVDDDDFCSYGERRSDD